MHGSFPHRTDEDREDLPRLAAAPSGGAASSLHFPQLDSLRGWAVLLVVLFHYSGILAGEVRLAPDDPWWRSWMIVGNTGVTLFFVLSGFLLSLPMVTGLARGARVPSRIGDFYMARVLRIVPLYLVAIAIAWAFTGDAANSLRALVFVPIGYAMFPFALVWWSLSTEVQFYLLLPLAFRLLGHRGGRFVVAAAGLAWLAVYLRYYHLAWWMENVEADVWRNSLFGRAPNFLAGIAAAWAFARGLRRERPAPAAWRVAFAVAGAALLSMLVTTAAREGFGPFDLRFPFWHAAEGIAWAMLLLAALRAQTPLALAWDNRVLRGLGTISYGVFLFHLPLQYFLLAPWAASSRGDAPLVVDSALALRVIASAILTVAVAAACHRVVEEPFLRLKARRRRSAGNA